MITHKVILNTCHRKIYKCIIIMRYSPPIYIVMYKFIFAYVYMDNQLPHDFLSNKVGETVMVEHVYPLLYNCQPSLLLADIQSFYATDCEIEDKYTTEQKPRCCTPIWCTLWTTEWWIVQVRQPHRTTCAYYTDFIEARNTTTRPCMRYFWKCVTMETTRVPFREWTGPYWLWWPQVNATSLQLITE